MSRVLWDSLLNSRQPSESAPEIQESSKLSPNLHLGVPRTHGSKVNLTSIRHLAPENDLQKLSQPLTQMGIVDQPALQMVVALLGAGHIEA